MTTREILLNAAKRVEWGWCQKTRARLADGAPGFNFARSFCLLAAIEKEAEGILEEDRAVDEVRAVLGVSTAWKLADWNDQPGRTYQEVADVLRAAAQRCG